MTLNELIDNRLKTYAQEGDYNILNSYGFLFTMIARDWANNKKENTADTPQSNWVCNACNYSEYTDAVSEDDVHHYLQCSNCGEDEFHLEPTPYASK